MQDNHARNTLAVLAVGAVLLAFFALLFFEMPAGNRDTINLIVGALLTVGFGSVFAYYFGSSRGSEKKTDALIDSVAQASRPPPGTAQITTSPDVDVELRKAAIQPDEDDDLPPGERVMP